MALNSAAFLFFFFPLVFLLYTVLPGRRVKNIFLTIAGLFFYALGQWQGVPLLLLCAFIGYAAGHLMDRPAWKKPALFAALMLELGLLVCFKYLNFFIGIVNAATSLDIPETPLFLPLGISFFTFKTISYVIDAYRDPGKSSRSFWDVLLYISFFPQIASGPISRFDQFILQSRKDRSLDPERAARGLRRFIVGFGKKALIAVPVATVADSAFSLETGLDIRMAWLGAVAYTVQIYFDFSGYSDMAIGLGTLFGFDTPENFRYPYAASSITGFWRRWHISLSAWFKDYLYIPLGGNRRGAARQALNKFIVFLLCGLWHGAGGVFVLWGVWHGVFSALESRKVIDCGRWRKNAVGRALSHVYVLLVVCLGFVLFRAADLTQAAAFFSALFAGFSLTGASSLALCRIAPAAWLALLAGLVGGIPLAPRLTAWAGALQGAPRQCVTVASFAGAAALFVLCLLASASGGFRPFIYAQF